MRISEELNALLNKQIHNELRNANIYSQVQCYFENLKLKNLANKFKAQSEEERKHANLFLDHINKRIGGIVTMGNVEMPVLNLNSLKNVGDAVIAVEQGTTAEIENILNIAKSEDSDIDIPFLLHIMEEQCNEEDEADEFQKTCYDIGDNMALLRLFDASLGD